MKTIITGKDFLFSSGIACLLEHRQSVQQNNSKNNQTVEIEYLIDSPSSSQLYSRHFRIYEVIDSYKHEFNSQS